MFEATTSKGKIAINRLTFYKQGVNIWNDYEYPTEEAPTLIGVAMLIRDFEQSECVTINEKGFMNSLKYPCYECGYLDVLSIESNREPIWVLSSDVSMQLYGKEIETKLPDFEREGGFEHPAPKGTRMLPEMYYASYYWRKIHYFKKEKCINEASRIKRLRYEYRQNIRLQKSFKSKKIYSAFGRSLAVEKCTYKSKHTVVPKFIIRDIPEFYALSLSSKVFNESLNRKYEDKKEVEKPITDGKKPIKKQEKPIQSKLF